MLQSDFYILKSDGRSLQVLTMKFKQGDRVWSKVYECWGNVHDKDVLCLCTEDEPITQYHVFLEGHRGEYTTTEDYLQSEEEHNAIRD